MYPPATLWSVIDAATGRVVDRLNDQLERRPILRRSVLRYHLEVDKAGEVQRRDAAEGLGLIIEVQPLRQRRSIGEARRIDQTGAVGIDERIGGHPEATTAYLLPPSGR